MIFQLARFLLNGKLEFLSIFPIGLDLLRSSELSNSLVAHLYQKLVEVPNYPLHNQKFIAAYISKCDGIEACILKRGIAHTP